MNKQLLATLVLTMFAVPVISGMAVSQFKIDPFPSEVQISDSTEVTSDNVRLNANVHVYKNGELAAEKHNVLMGGEAAVTNLLSTGDTYEYETIAVGNTTAPQDSDTELPGRITTHGFAPTAGSVTTASDGSSYNVTHTFTATGSIDVNTTALESNTGHNSITDVNGNDIDTLAGTSFGRTIPFEADDQLTVEYQVITDDPTT